MNDERHYAPATLRNRDAILEVLRPLLPNGGLVLEIASGSGEHCVHFARALPGLTFQPSDPDERGLASIRAWARHAHLHNILPPVALDAASRHWPVQRAEAVLCINMIHISPWEATLGLMAGAGAILPQGAPLYLYGPYIRDGVETAPSNLEFDADLRRRDPRWGLRSLAEVAGAAAAVGFSAPQVTEMAANNLSVAFLKA